MKYSLLTLIGIVSLSACTSTAPVIPNSHGAQTLPQARNTLSTHQQKAEFNQHFCRGEGFKYYTETVYSYSFVCKDGSYFSLIK